MTSSEGVHEPRIRVQVVPAEARRLQGRRAGLVSRVIASVVDIAVAFGILAGTYLARAFVRLIWEGKSFTLPTWSFPRAFALGELILIAYLAVSWTASGRTYGDRLMGLRVVDRHRRTMRLGWSSTRALLCALFPLGLLWVGIGRENRSVQDLILRTSVIYDWQSRVAGAEAATADGASDDALGPGVDVQPPIANEPGDRHPESLAGLDRE